MHAIKMTGKMVDGEHNWSYLVLKSLSRVLLFATPWTVVPRLLCPWDSPGKNTGVGCRSLLRVYSYTVVLDLMEMYFINVTEEP